MSERKLGIYGTPVTETKEDSMDYYFVVINESNIIDSVIHRTAGVKPAQVSGKRFVKATGVNLSFYYKLQAESSQVNLDEVLAFGS